MLLHTNNFADSERLGQTARCGSKFKSNVASSLCLFSSLDSESLAFMLVRDFGWGGGMVMHPRPARPGGQEQAEVKVVCWSSSVQRPSPIRGISSLNPGSSGSGSRNDVEWNSLRCCFHHHRGRQFGDIACWYSEKKMRQSNNCFR